MRNKKKRGETYFRGIREHAVLWNVAENHLRYVLKGERNSPAMEEDYYRRHPEVKRFDKVAHLKALELARRARL